MNYEFQKKDDTYRKTIMSNIPDRNLETES